jgi:hypothetical protein
VGLFRPVWMKRDPISNEVAKRIRHAINDITDPDKLADIARRAPGESTRSYAARRIKDERVLFEIASTDPSLPVAKNAAELMSDQDLVATLARTAPRIEVRRKAAYRLFDRHAMVEVLKEIEQHDVEVALHDPDPEVRRKALWEVQDRSVLQRIAKQDDVWRNRRIALVRLFGPGPAARERSDEPEFRAVCRNIGDPQLLRSIIEAADSPSDRREARMQLFLLRGAVPDEREHDWSPTTDCLRECRRCWRLEHDHDYRSAGRPREKTNVMPVAADPLQCSRCGNGAHFRDSDDNIAGYDSRETGLIRA